MRRSLSIFFIICASLSGYSRISAQDVLNDTAILNDPSLQESFMLATDRDLYASGETLCFRAFNTSPAKLRSPVWSKVLYLELMSIHGIPVVQLKVPSDEHGAMGCISLSDTLRSGVYQLRAYTRWMRNFDPETYARQAIYIINPHKPARGFPESAGDSESEVPFPDLDPGLSIQADMPRYGRREQVEVQIDALPDQIQGDPQFCISVIPKGNLDVGRWGTADPDAHTTPLYQTVRYIPETRGMSLTGKIIPASGDGLIGNTEAHMTLLGAEPDYVGFHSDFKGNIYLALPRHFGARDVLISVDHEDDVKVMVDDEFSHDFLPAESQDDLKFWDRKEAIQSVMINAQLQEAMGSEASEENHESVRAGRDPIPFYNQPDRRLLTSDYVELPTLGEFFFELVPEVRLRKDGGRSIFVIYPYSGKRSLVLLDYVAIPDLDDMLKIPPARIRHIDIIGKAYQRGENFYDGIISIVSKDGDLGGIDLPRNSKFFSFRTFDSPEELRFPDHEVQPADARIPDLRNTLFWKPNLNINKDSPWSVRFYTSDIPGTYQVVVRGHDDARRTIQAVTEFVVE